MRANYFCGLTTTESRAMILYLLYAFTPPTDLGCCSFYGGGSVIVNLLFIVALIVCGGSLFGPCCVN